MRRFAISAATLLLLLPPPASAHAQVTLRLTAGPNIATWVWPAGAERHEPWSWHGPALGVSAGLPVAGNWGIQLGGGLSVKGYSREHEGECGNAQGTSYVCASGKWITYFESTVLADRQIRLGDRFRLHLLAGPALGYQWDEYPERAADFDFGIAGGAHVETQLSGRLGLLIGALSFVHDRLSVGGCRRPSWEARESRSSGEPAVSWFAV